VEEEEEEKEEISSNKLIFNLYPIGYCGSQWDTKLK
jgi:hypothetical protein